MPARFILAIDQGTTSSRALVFDSAAQRVASAQMEFAQHYPAPDRVEHDPREIWATTVKTVRNALAQGGLAAADIAAIGIANQRETVVIWDRASGEPIHRAIVWQDRRTAEACNRLRAAGTEDTVRAVTGLLLDPYFSATKLAWILDAVPGARTRAARGELAFGTIDSFLLWQLTGGRVHATDAANASRTLLFDIAEGGWSPAMCELFGVPPELLPAVVDNSGEIGATDPELFGAAIPICGMAGDQQAALFGQACFAPGTLKSTYGTGCFMVMNTGEAPLRSNNRLLSSVGYRLGGRTTYVLEGSIFVAGAAVQWLRDRLGLFRHAGETQALAEQLEDNGGVYLVPAFTGLGAPHWDSEARGALHGLTLASGPEHIARAALEAVAYQTMDLVAAMVADGARLPPALRVDGGMAANDWFCTFLAGMIGTRVDRPAELETTARGAAYLAGLGSGVWSSLGELERLSHFERRFEPQLPASERRRLAAGWHEALGRTLATP